MLRDMLRREGHYSRPQACGHADEEDGHRGAVQEAQHQPPPSRTSGLSVFAARPADRAAESRLGCRHHVHPDEARLHLPVRGDGLGQPPGVVVALSNTLTTDFCIEAVQEAITLRHAGNLQHRPGQPVHQPGIHAAAQGSRHCHQYGRQRLLAR